MPWICPVRRRLGKTCRAVEVMPLTVAAIEHVVIVTSLLFYGT